MCIALDSYTAFGDENYFYFFVFICHTIKSWCTRASFNPYCITNHCLGHLKAITTVIRPRVFHCTAITCSSRFGTSSGLTIELINYRPQSAFMVGVLPLLDFVNRTHVAARSFSFSYFAEFLNRAISINSYHFHTLVLMSFEEFDTGSIKFFSSSLNPDIAILVDLCVHVDIVISLTTHYFRTCHLDLDIKIRIKLVSSCIAFATITFSTSDCLHNF